MLIFSTVKLEHYRILISKEKKRGGGVQVELKAEDQVTASEFEWEM